jgi:hypothetical protein
VLYLPRGEEDSILLNHGHMVSPFFSTPVIDLKPYQSAYEADRHEVPDRHKRLLQKAHRVQRIRGPPRLGRLAVDESLRS